MIARMYEDAAERLMMALTATFGTGPRWELLPNRSYGFYLHYDDEDVPLGDLRSVIDATLNYSVGVILAPRGKWSSSPPSTR